MQGNTYVLLLQLDHAWSHPWESVQTALKGVSEEVGNWQAECYRSETPEPNWPQPGTIRRHVAHLAACKREYLEKIKARPKDASPETEYFPCSTLKEGLSSLSATHSELRAAIAALSDADLEDKVLHGQVLFKHRRFNMLRVNLD